MKPTHLFKSLLNLIIRNEKHLDHLRSQLAQNSLFSLKPIFNRLDQARQGYIDTADFIAFCQDHDIQLTSREAYYTLKWLDRDMDSKVTFEDFCKIILPKDKYQQRLNTALREPYQIEKNMYLPMQIEKPLAQYVAELVQSIREQLELKASILSSSEFNVYQIYNLIDPINKGITQSKQKLYRLNIHSLKNFLEVSEEDIEYFFWVADYDQDGHISCQEFIEIIMNADQGQNIQPITFHKIQQNRVEQSQSKLKHEYSANYLNRSITPKKQSQTYKYVPERNNPQKSFTPIRHEKNQVQLPYSQTAYNSNLTEDTNTTQPIQKKKFKDSHGYQQKTPEKKSGSQYILIQEQMQSPEPLKKEPKKTYIDIKKNYVQKTVKKSQPQDYKNFFKFLLKQILLLRECEEAKRQLALRPDFTILEGFRILDTNSQGQLNQGQFLRSLQVLALNLTPPLDVVQLVFKQYCQNPNTMRYADFHQIVISQTADYAILLDGRNQQQLSEPTIKLFMQLLDIVLRNESIISQYRDSIEENPAELFKLLNKSNKSHLDENDFREFLREYDVFPTAIELKRLIRRYSRDTQVKYDQFHQQLSKE